MVALTLCWPYRKCLGKSAISESVSFSVLYQKKIPYNISHHFPQIPAAEACLIPNSAGSYAFSILPFVSVRTAHLLWGKGELLCIFIRSWGLQVAERTRLIT